MLGMEFNAGNAYLARRPEPAGRYARGKQTAPMLRIRPAVLVARDFDAAVEALRATPRSLNRAMTRRSPALAA